MTYVYMRLAIAEKQVELSWTKLSQRWIFGSFSYSNLLLIHFIWTFERIALFSELNSLLIEWNYLLREKILNKSLSKEWNFFLVEWNSFLQEWHSLLREWKSLLRKWHSLLRKWNSLLRKWNSYLKNRYSSVNIVLS